MIRFCDCCNMDRLVKISIKEIPDYKKIIDRKYNIVTCLTCNHSFIDPMPGEEEIINFYPKSYYAHVPSDNKKISIKEILKKKLINMYYGKFSNYKLVKTFQYLIFLLLRRKINEPPRIENGKILDIGCGNGEYLLMIRQFGWEVYGLELNEQAVFLARKHGLNVLQGSAEAIEYESNFFDIVRMWNVLEHTISPRKALLEVSRVLKRGGYLLIYVPNFDSIERKIFSKYWSSLEVPRHVHHFSVKSLKLYLNHAGLVLDKWLYPGMIFSTILPTIKIMREEKIRILNIFYKSILCASNEIFHRLYGDYSKSAGICILAKKV